MAEGQSPSLGGTLFGAAFFLMGFAFFIGFVGLVVIDRIDMQAWQPMQAEILDTELKSHRDDDGGTTYQVVANYRYDFAGHSYRGYRINVHTGSDNFGSYQQDMYHRLSFSQQQERPVAGWVNPEDPYESVLDRELRWLLVVFPTMLCSLFMVVGAGLLYISWRKQPVPDPAVVRETPWLARTEWSPDGIASNNKLMLGVSWVIALAVNTLGVPFLYLAVSFLVQGKFVGLLLALPGLLGFYVLYRAIRKTLEHWRFGRVPVVLNPFPGEIGGHVAGFLAFSRRLHPAAKFRVTLQQMKTTTTRMGDETRVESCCLWDLTMEGTLRNSGLGSRVHFAFAVPKGMPQSRTTEGSGYWWCLEAKGEMSGVAVNRSYEIPVFRTGNSLSVPLEAGIRVATANADFTEQLEAMLDIEQRDGGVLVRQAPGKQRLAWPLAIYGGIFAAIGVGVGIAGAPILFPIVFSGLGLLVASIGIKMLITGYETFIGPEGAIHKVSRSGREKKQVAWPRAQLLGLCLHRSGSGGSKGKAVEYFDLLLQHVNGETLKVSGGIEGRQAAEQLLESMKLLAGLKALDEYKTNLQLKREEMQA